MQVAIATSSGEMEKVGSSTGCILAMHRDSDWSKKVSLRDCME